jgi:hypothetical protein
MDMNFGFDFDNVIRELGACKNFTELNEMEFDFMGDDEFYERTKDWNIDYDGEDWSENGF